jgi:curved DNA-binding protein CbpA
MPGPDPYKTLGVSPGASDAELRAAYRRLVQLHHPDHNGGSEASARRFEAIQEDYARIRELRARTPRATSGQAPPSAPVDPEVDARLANLERELREAQLARARAQRAAREAAAETRARAETDARPSDEELGYVSTDDSFSKIFSDALSDLSRRVSEAKASPAGERVGGLIDELEELAGKFTRKPPPRPRD